MIHNLYQMSTKRYNEVSFRSIEQDTWLGKCEY